MTTVKQFFVPVLLLITDFVLGVFLSVVLSMRSDIKTLDAELQRLQIVVARDYATKSDLKESVYRIEKKLDSFFKDNYQVK